MNPKRDETVVESEFDWWLDVETMPTPIEMRRQHPLELTPIVYLHGVSFDPDADPEF